ncbi:hypothetical protein HKX48_003766 [Thoreauomyces humboldtii]|nr:hypothetical protein HKX48_003766 [Thoreauomyces humboldtii]
MPRFASRRRTNVLSDSEASGDEASASDFSSSSAGSDSDGDEGVDTPAAATAATSAPSGSAATARDDPRSDSDADTSKRIRGLRINSGDESEESEAEEEEIDYQDNVLAASAPSPAVDEDSPSVPDSASPAAEDDAEPAPEPATKSKRDEKPQRRLDPAFTPSLGKFWGHDDRFSGGFSGPRRGGGSFRGRGGSTRGTANVTSTVASGGAGERRGSRTEADGAPSEAGQRGFFSTLDEEDDPTAKQWVHDKFAEVANLPPRGRRNNVKAYVPKSAKTTEPRRVHGEPQVGNAVVRPPSSVTVDSHAATQAPAPRQSKRYMTSAPPPEKAVTSTTAAASPSPSSSAALRNALPAPEFVPQSYQPPLTSSSPALQATPHTQRPIKRASFTPVTYDSPQPYQSPYQQPMYTGLYIPGTEFVPAADPYASQSHMYASQPYPYPDQMQQDPYANYQYQTAYDPSYYYQGQQDPSMPPSQPYYSSQPYPPYAGQGYGAPLSASVQPVRPAALTSTRIQIKDAKDGKVVDLKQLAVST